MALVLNGKKLTDAEAAAMIEQLQAEQAKLMAERDAAKAAAAGRTAGGSVSVKANVLGGTLQGGEPTKGNIGVYGIQQRPITLYAAQWMKLFQQEDAIKAAIRANLSGLSFKDGGLEAVTAWLAEQPKA